MSLPYNNDLPYRRIKDIGTLRLGKMLATKPDDGGELRMYLKSKNIGWLSLNLESVEEMYFLKEEMQRLRLHKGDLLFSEGGEVGKTAIWDNEIEECYIQNSVHKLTVHKGNNPRYFMYLSYLFGQTGYYKSIVNLVSIMHLTSEKLRSIEVPVPTKERQDAIAEYLDKKTNEINERIWLRERELQTLIKLKQSEIDAVVTRGLNPNVKMKDSGIDWIGQIPEHWEVRRFKEIFKSYTTGITPESKKADNFETEGGYPWITIADINDRKYVRSGALNLSEKVIQEFAPPLTKKGSLMFSFKLSIGKVAFADQDLYTNEAIVSIPPTKKQCFDYFYYVLPNVLMNNATENIYGAKMLNQKIISNMCFALPPKEEQEAIAKYLNEKFEEINKLISNINLQIEKLQLLKKSLINEVITGQRAI